MMTEREVLAMAQVKHSRLADLFHNPQAPQGEERTALVEQERLRQLRIEELRALCRANGAHMYRLFEFARITVDTWGNPTSLEELKRAVETTTMHYAWSDEIYSLLEQSKQHVRTIYAWNVVAEFEHDGKQFVRYYEGANSLEELAALLDKH
jgi:hypothetical protein